MFFLPSNAQKGSLYDPKENSLAISYGKQYRDDRQSNYVFGGEFYTGYGNNFFRPMIGAYVTGNNSYFASFTFSKDVVLTEKFALSGHIGPAYSNIRGKDRLSNSGYVNFNLAIGGYYKLLNNLAVGVEWRHFSNNYTALPNIGIDTINFKVRYKI